MRGGVFFATPLTLPIKAVAACQRLTGPASTLDGSYATFRKLREGGVRIRSPLRSHVLRDKKGIGEEQVDDEEVGAVADQLRDVLG